jgi:hypothetical protein
LKDCENLWNNKCCDGGVGDSEDIMGNQWREGLMVNELTEPYRLAVEGIGPLAYDWEDKPHRLVFDLCAELEYLNEWMKLVYATTTDNDLKAEIGGMIRRLV